MANKADMNLMLAWLLRAKQTSRRGFTLIELLVAIVVGSLIVGTMLYLVVEMLRINRREEILTQTQQDMRRAIDYITRDAGEAVYIYSTPAAVLGQLNGFPNGGEVPVLAFWRLDPLDPTNAGVRTFFNTACSAAFSGVKLNECNTLRLRQGYYTLVIYAQQQNTGNDIWGGRSRIVRYELPKYTATGLSSLTITPGYAEPTGSTNTFATWTKGTGTTPRNLSVLTDYVDNTDPNEATTGLCPTGYLQTPANANNFYACVRQGTTQVSTEDSSLTVGSNQTLIVFLRGNTAADNPALGAFSQAGRLPTLKSEVLIRGVIDKQPGL
ncbi:MULTISPECIES: prepilin-type N-terminal cleavage/methylation domain-containing protein [Cyanophyceae]|uniref:Prepilin-type N-terminal cleavage/methylation domain-containing protein n=1 Tax=Leptolyngbya subtilissima DQ-A4 TaxID=2933933 RepID=A0ABV0K2S0_9CYAN|nr:prepilin-type N-terminal cleavage/methylation domain-containing protein [Nodosilinea sp. FACHB-141]MBD2113041.1 prepilin-type N-terminal cleavage/methylation domain-containing protein [Nodosilinea sp. FACHB-141]